MTLPDYPYAGGNRLVDRNTYFYTPAVGQPMVKAWQVSRSTVLATLPEPVPLDTAVSDGVLAASGAVVTADLLAQLAANLQNGATSDTVDFWLDLLVHKFETTKYLPRAYDAQFKAIDRTKRNDLDLYLRFADVLVLAFRADDKLPRLNALLKVIDTLCSVRDQLPDAHHPHLAHLLVQKSDNRQIGYTVKNHRKPVFGF